MNTPTCFLDGFGPLPLVQPGSTDELGEFIRQAAIAGTAIYPVGGQTKITLGNPPTKPGTAIDLRGLARVIDFPARDMTITVQTGITIQSLRDIVASEKLRLPIDVAQADRATLGGILAANISGPRRLGYGTLRDYLIGISALNDDGREFKAGGRVVKNVAGYDLCKLLVGSLGTLGILTQATLKLRPVAEQQALLTLPCNPSNLEELLTTLHSSRARPVCIELLNQAAAQVVFTQAGMAVPGAPWIIVVGYEGNTEAVTWQMQQLVKELAPQRWLDVRVDFTTQPLWEALVEFAAWPLAQSTFQASVLPSAVALFCQAIERDGHPLAMRAHAGSGIVTGHWPVGLTMDELARMLTAWRQLAQTGQGSVVVANCPSAWKGSLDVWGPPPAGAWLMREIKAKFDPRGIFNPGRFVAGI